MRRRILKIDLRARRIGRFDEELLSVGGEV
jgi:hypothetical protein